jgi:hypothetical protein
MHPTRIQANKMMRPYHRFVDFVEANKHQLDSHILCKRPEYALYLIAHPEKIYWPVFSENPAPEAIALLKANPDKIYWRCFSANPAAIAMLQASPDRIYWRQFCRNPAPEAIAMLKSTPWKISRDHLCMNRSAEAMKMIKVLVPYWIEPADLRTLSANYHAIEFFVNNPERIDWRRFCNNCHPQAMALLLQHPDRIDWEWLSSNTNPIAIEMLRANPDKIHWQNLSYNASIFVLDYAKMTRQMAPLKDELLRNRMHPSRIYQAEHHWLLL